MVFLDNMLTVFSQVAVLAMLMAVGFAGDRIGFFTERAARMCNDLLFYVITPCVIINSFTSVEFTRSAGSGFLGALICAVVFHVIAMGVSFAMFNRGDKNENIVFKYAVMYGNTGYMGIPLAQAVMRELTGSGEIGVFYCSACVAVFNIFSFTHGVWLMSGKRGISPLKLILNPGTLPVLIGVPLFVFGIRLPEFIALPISHIGSMNTPLAMIMFGTYLSHADFRSAFRSKNIYITAVVKLVLMPICVIFLLYLCGVSGDLLVVASVFVSAPTANNTVMFAAKYGRDTGLASQVAGFTGVLSVLTMPACVALGIMLS